MRMVFTMRSMGVLASMICAWAMVCAGQANLNLGQIVSRIQQARAAEHGRSVPYTVTREYQLQAQGSAQANSQVVAQVNFVPPTAKEYTIVKAEGSDRGTGIVRKVLDHEVTMATHADANEVSPANYDFTLIGRDTIDGHDCYLLGISPKREAVELVRGRAWVDAKTFDIRRIQGVTAKNPSFWIKNLNVTLNYGEVNGVWVQTSTQAVADVRIAGPHVLTSRELNVQAATYDARSQAPSKVRAQRSNGRRAVADAATWVAR
jgi:Outer membrane lipoprotein-sorting protein